MAKFVMECPACKKPIQAGTGLFAKKSVKCSCGYTINVQLEKMATDTCPHCGNDVVYDRTKKDSATCPVCHTKIHAGTEKIKLHCPSCKMELTADKNASTYTCPQCKSLIDVQAAVAKQARRRSQAVTICLQSMSYIPSVLSTMTASTEKRRCLNPATASLWLLRKSTNAKPWRSRLSRRACTDTPRIKP